MQCFLTVLASVFFIQAAEAGVILDYMSQENLTEIRAIDGKGNNIEVPKSGTPGVPFSRMLPADYGDRVSSPTKRDINPRAISNNFFQSEETQNYKKASDFLWLWGQFIDHDITLTDLNKNEPMNIEIPKCDRYFDLSCTGTNELVFFRSESVLVDGVREQINRTTSYLDGSMIYGSNMVRAQTLRTMDGSGKFILDSNGYLPKNKWGLPNLPSSSPYFFAAGDIRVNDHIGLMAMHNLFAREHNYWAEELRKKNKKFSGDELYQKARAIVIAEIQNITFNEFLPILVGTYAPAVDSKYNENLESSILSEFSTSAYRMGHTLVSGDFYLESVKGVSSTVKLRDSFFNPSEYSRSGIESIMLGFSKHVAQERDPMINKELQNFIMVSQEEGIFDLFAFNIQRGRDHGIPSYNDLREAVGFSRVREFNEISKNGDFNYSMEVMYKSVDEIDPWLGLIAEKASNSALLGATASHIIARQFKLLRDSDRFWFTNAYGPKFVKAIKDQTLSKIIARNTKISQKQLSDEVFLVR